MELHGYSPVSYGGKDGSSGKAKYSISLKEIVILLYLFSLA